MKKLIFLFAAIASLAFTTDVKQYSFVGRWTGEDQGDVGFMNFDEEGYVSFETNGQVMGGKEFEMEGVKASMTYEIMNESNPVHIDLIMTVEGMPQPMRLPCLAEFLDKNTMKFALNFDSQSRPEGFTEDNSIVLTRVKK